LVIYHNTFGDTKGWIKTSTGVLDKGSGKLKRRNLAEGLGLPRQGYMIFKDYSSQLEFIRSCEEIWKNGMYVELGAYQCHAFMDFRFVYDKEWGTICEKLNGAGVSSIHGQWQKMFAKVETVVEEKPAKKKRAAKKPAVKKTVVKAKVSKKTTPKKTAVKTKAVKKAPAATKVVTKTAAKKKAVEKKTVSKPKVSAKKGTTVKSSPKGEELAKKPVEKKKVSKKKEK